MATIIKILIDGQTRTINLEEYWKDVVSFGRSAECDIELSKPYVSRLHGCFYYDKGNWYYKDLNSVNGIYKNGSKTSEEPLNEGDELVISTSPKDSDCIKLSVCTSKDLDRTDTLKGSGARSSVSSSSSVNSTSSAKAKSAVNSSSPVSKPVDTPAKTFSGAPETSKKTNVWVFVAIGLVVVIGLVALVFGLRKLSNSDNGGKDNATMSDATPGNGMEESTVAETPTEAETETTEATFDEQVEEKPESVTVEDSIDSTDENKGSKAEGKFYSDDFQLTEYGALTGVKNYYFKRNPEMKDNEDIQNSWSITNTLISEGNYEGCIEIEYKSVNSENDKRTYYYVNKSSGDVVIEEYVDGTRIKSSEKFNVNDYLD